MDKLLAFITERNHADKIITKVMEYENNSEVVIITADVPKPCTELTCYDIKEYVSRDYEEIANRKAQLWIKKWSNKKILEKKSFKELISYEGVSLWWFLEFYYFYISKISHIARSIEIITSVIIKEKPTNILVVKNDSVFSAVLESYARVNNLKTIPLHLKSIKNRDLKKNIYNSIRSIVRIYWKTILTIKEIFRSNFTNLLNMFLSKKIKEQKDSVTIVVISPERFWGSIIDIRTGKLKDGFFLTDKIIRKFSEDSRLLLVSYHSFFDKMFGLKILLKEKMTYPNVVIKTPESWETSVIKSKVRTMKNRLNNIWNILKENNEFQTSLNFDGVPLWGILRKDISRMFFVTLPEAVRWIETMQAMIDKEKPSALVLPGEYCSHLGYASIIAGKKKQVPTIAIQHGVITRNSLEYTIASSELGEGINSKFWIVPTKLAVYGNYTKKALESIFYPADNIEITGHPDYDVLFNLEKIMSKKEILKDLVISENKKIITFTTQAFWSMKSREVLLRMVLQAVKALHNVVLLIKPHPVENESWHKNILKDVGIKNVIILSKTYNTSKALYVCDLMITSSSTTALGAMALNKPVININLEGQSEGYPYSESGAAISVDNSEKLNMVIKKIFKDAELRTKLEKNREKFLSDHLFKIDGLSSERIINLILKMVK